MVAMDIPHLATKGETDAGYVLRVIDVYSRCAIAMPISDTKSLTVATAPRDDLPTHRWRRPTRFVLDGAWYFKAEQDEQLQ